VRERTPTSLDNALRISQQSEVWFKDARRGRQAWRTKSTQCTGIVIERARRCAGHCYQIRPPVRTSRCFRLCVRLWRRCSAGSVETFLIDFEQAAIDAIQDVFPAVTVKGCTFHFRQTVVRHLQQEEGCGRHTSPQLNIQMSVCGCDESWQCLCCRSLPFHSAEMFYESHRRLEIPLWTPRPLVCGLLQQNVYLRLLSATSVVAFRQRRAAYRRTEN